MIEIRDAGEEDLDWLCRREEENFSLPWTREQLSHQIGEEGRALLIAESDGVRAGYIGMDSVLDEGCITNVCTAPEYRRRGVGAALIDAAIKRARAWKLSFLTLEVRASNAPARGLYEKKGFKFVGIRPGYYEKPAEDAAIMTFYIRKEEL